jgi:hypothetical protein
VPETVAVDEVIAPCTLITVVTNCVVPGAKDLTQARVALDVVLGHGVVVGAPEEQAALLGGEQAGQCGGDPAV